MSDERRGALCVLAAALLWSTGGVAIKAVAEPALKVACYRSAVAAVVLAAFFRPRLWRRIRLRRPPFPAHRTRGRRSRLWR